jgi:hypothetical protein
MADMIQAYQAYSPKVKIEHMVEMNEVIPYIVDRTGLNTSEVHFVLMELHASLRNFTRKGCSVRLEGVGLFSPAVDKEGNFGVNNRADKELITRLNDSGAFIGKVRNKDMIGKSTDAFIERWNEEHPNDKIKKK